MQQREPSASESYFWPSVWAIGLHVVVFAMLFVSFSYTDAILTSSGLPNGRVAKSTPTGSRAATGPTSHVPSADDGSGTHERITCEAAGALYRRRDTNVECS